MSDKIYDTSKNIIYLSYKDITIMYNFKTRILAKAILRYKIARNLNEDEIACILMKRNKSLLLIIHNTPVL